MPCKFLTHLTALFTKGRLFEESACGQKQSLSGARAPAVLATSTCIGSSLWQQLVQQRAPEPEKKPKEESGRCQRRHVDQTAEFCVPLGCDPPQTLGVIVWPLLLESELGEQHDSLRRGRGGMSECLIYLGSHMGNELIIELVSS